MEKWIIKDIPIEMKDEEVFRALKMPPDTQEEDASAILRMKAEVLQVAKPKAVYGIAAIEEKGGDYVVVEGKRIPSALVRKNLENTNRIFPFVATCGTEAEEWSKQYTDFLEQYWADGFKLLLLVKIRNQLTKTIRSTYFASGAHMACMNPGSLPQWPLQQQALLFHLIGDVTESIGVRLTDSFLMLPSKSSSGFFFSSKEEYQNCQHCPMKNCPNRRAEYIGPPETA